MYFGEINLKENEDNDNDYFFNVPKDFTLYLKLRQKVKKSNPLDLLYIDENKEYNEIFNNIDLDEKNEKNEKNKEKSNLKGSGRDKEKTIGYSIKKLFMWQKIREKSNSKITLVEETNIINPDTMSNLIAIIILVLIPFGLIIYNRKNSRNNKKIKEL